MGDDEGSKSVRPCVRVTFKSRSLPKERAFEIYDEVFAFDKDKWWEGVITKVLEDSRCAVYIRTTGEEFEFRQSDLLRRYNRQPIQPEKQKKETKRHSMTGVGTVSRKRVCPPRGKKTSSQKTTAWKATELQNRTRGTSRKVMVTERDPPTMGSGHNACSRETANDAEIYITGVSRDNMGASPADGLFYQSNEVDSRGGASVEGLGTEELFKVTKKCLITSEKVKSLGKECTDAIEQQDEMTHVVVHDQCNESTNEQIEITLHHCKEVRKENSQMVSTDNQHKEAREKHTVVLPSLVADTTNNKVSVQHNESLPFVKNSVMWKEIEAMEIFQQMPQQPHFRPLEQYIAIHREGMAIGHMITFTNLVTKIGESQLNMPRSELEEMLKDLVDLETHGFNVGKLQARVKKLLRMKHKQEMVESRSKEVEEKINKLKTENDKFDVEIVEMEESLRKHEETILKLKQGQESFTEKKEKNASDIIAMQMEMDVIKNNFMSAKDVKPQNQITTKNLLRYSLDRYLSQTRIFKNRTVINRTTSFRFNQPGH